jgi:serine/threonine-protein kinase HipA
MTAKCLGCYEAVDEVGIFHPACAQKVFGVRWTPALKILPEDFARVAQEMAGHMSISGVQPKISGNLNRKTKSIEAAPSGGEFILKPPNDRFEDIPANEDLCMHLAELYGIETPPHALMRAGQKEFVYVIRRFDRVESGEKRAVEDMAQVLGVPTAKKYNLSHEKVGEGILRYCTNSYLELGRYMERLLFCFLIGNGDMHLKNFSLMTDEKEAVALSPAYDLLSSKLVIPREEDFALTLNGKKNGLKKKDFVEFASRLGISAKVVDSSLQRLLGLRPVFQEWTEKSLLPPEKRNALLKIIDERAKRISSFLY